MSEGRRNPNASSWFYPSEQEHETIVVHRPRAIAVIFVPGVMGSNLRAKHSKASVWMPPDGKPQGLSESLRWGNIDADARQKIFIPENCEVDDQGQLAKHHGPLPRLNQYATAADAREYRDALKILPCGLTIEEGIERGWGSVHWESYGPILEHLQTSLNPWAHGNEQREESLVHSLSDLLASENALNGAAESGTSIDAIDPSQLRDLADYQFPVYCAGYNWLQSNQQSASDIVNEWLPKFKKHCRETLRVQWAGAIIVTHSMGGLVGRALASLIPHNEKILGVVHGAMPANGAALFYVKMRKGSRDGTLIGYIAAEILGSTAVETVPVLCNAPGPLELLPTPDYERLMRQEYDHSYWLEAGYDKISVIPGHGFPVMTPPRFLDAGQGPVITQQPSNNVVSDIYANISDWYRMVGDPALIDPAGILDGGDMDVFFKNLETAIKFHESMEKKDGGYHPVTYAFYGDDAEKKSYACVRWNCELMNDQVPPQKVLGVVEDTHKGSVRLATDKGNFWFHIAPPEDSGDGTVPGISGKAPLGRAGIQALFKINQLEDYDHQTIYNHDLARRCTEYGILRIAATGIL